MFNDIRRYAAGKQAYLVQVLRTCGVNMLIDHMPNPENTRISTSGCCSLRITLCSRCMYNAVLVPPAACKTSRTSAQTAARRQVLGTCNHLGELLPRTHGRPVRIRMVLAAVAFSCAGGLRGLFALCKAHAPWAAGGTEGNAR